MTTEDDFRAAIRAAPADDALRLVYADFLDEQPERVPCPHCGGGRPGEWMHAIDARGRCATCKGTDLVANPALDQARATAEFVRLTCTGRTVLSAKAGKWLDGNWKRLVPEFAGWYETVRTEPECPLLDSWWQVRRSGRQMELLNRRRANEAPWAITPPTGRGHRAEIEFHRGFVRKVVVRDWRCADLLLPLLVGDQPFVEPVLTSCCREEGVWLGGGDQEAGPRTHPKGGVMIRATVFRQRVGPCIDLAGSAPEHGGRWEQRFYAAGSDNDARARSARAVSAALLERAHLIRAGQALAGADDRRPQPQPEGVTA